MPLLVTIVSILMGAGLLVVFVSAAGVLTNPQRRQRRKARAAQQGALLAKTAAPRALTHRSRVPVDAEPPGHAYARAPVQVHQQRSRTDRRATR